MTDNATLIIAAVIAAFPPTLAVIITGRTQGKKADIVVDKLDEQNKTAVSDRAIVAQKATEASIKLEVVHGLVNSKLADEQKARAAAEAAQQAAETEVVRLRSIIEKRAT